MAIKTRFAGLFRRREMAVAPASPKAHWSIIATTVTIIGLVGLAYFSFWPRGYALWGVAASILCVSSGIVYFLPDTRRWKEALDWRVWAIVIATDVSLIITFFLLVFDAPRNLSNFWGSVFSSWVGGVIFFAVVGAVVAVLSIARPEQDSFDARARILFRRQRGMHIEYIVERIKDLFEHFAERTEKFVIIDSYNEAEKKFLLIVENETAVRNYIDDIQTTYESKVSFSELTDPPTGGPSNQILYIRINGRPYMAGRHIGSSFEEKFATTINRSEACIISYAVRHWVAAITEPNSHRPVRYTQRISLRIENRLTENYKVVVKLKAYGSDDTDSIDLLPGEKKLLLERLDLRPGADVYEYSLELKS